jgi:hypothetical protein
VAIVEARRYRLAARAFCRNGGSVEQLARATLTTKANVRSFLRGEFGLLTGAKAARIEDLFSERTAAWVRESRCYDMQAGQIPCTLVAPLIRESLARYGGEGTRQMTGLVPRQLYGILRERQAIRYGAADRLVVSLVGPTWWKEDRERLRWYWQAERVFGAKEARARRPRRRELVAA